MDWYIQFDKRMEQELPAVKVVCDEPMSHHTSFHIGGGAKRMAFPETEEQLSVLMTLAHESGANPLVVGRGTNLLVADEGLDCLVVNTTDLNDVKLLDEQRIRAAAGISLARLADFACKQGLTGLEFAHGIPGTLGGGVCMNAGAYDGEMRQVLESVTAWFPGEGVRTLALEELQLSYRHSLFSDHPEAVVMSAVLTLEKGDSTEIREKMLALMARRKASQPLEYPSAGSTFKRPTGYFAGTLIDQCGLKGFTVGGAQVSEKHAGFVINIGGATCADVKSLIEQVQQYVLEKTGVRMEPEVRIIG